MSRTYYSDMRGPKDPDLDLDPPPGEPVCICGAPAEENATVCDACRPEEGDDG